MYRDSLVTLLLPDEPTGASLWGSGVKEMKRLMRKIAGAHRLTFEELNTVIVEAEATLNSRPLPIVDSLPEDGMLLVIS